MPISEELNCCGYNSDVSSKDWELLYIYWVPNTC